MSNKTEVRLTENINVQLAERVKEMAYGFHHRDGHDGYFTTCNAAVCVENKELLKSAGVRV